MKCVAKICWSKRSDEPFIDGKYSRQHTWSFDGGIEVIASSSPQIVPVPFSLTAAVDPEEAFVASISSCHMLFFLSLAAGKNLIVERYEDAPEGTLGKDPQGRMVIKTVRLTPAVTFVAGSEPPHELVTQLHTSSHARCFIANSVKTAVEIVPQMDMDFKPSKPLPGGEWIWAGLVAVKKMYSNSLSKVKNL